MFSTVRQLSKPRTSFRKGLSVRLVHGDTLLVPEAYPLLPLEEARSGKYEVYRRGPKIDPAQVNSVQDIIAVPNSEFTSLTTSCSTRSKIEIVPEKVDKLEEELQRLQDVLLYCESVRVLEKSLLPGFLPKHEHIRTCM
eukprot:TRINITY_DN133_c0_g1_i2.p1 TRINITY_DN133_c0_g1~~TRINITY_DN133_c0_g1_i2.p1  ORF type:complete len:139 (-),score=8.01 TRINITY_DN133_c0_g1_i2:373-789(-)